jgi:hypothetical protein
MPKKACCGSSSSKIALRFRSSNISFAIEKYKQSTEFHEIKVTI